jgi:hypothetical protein
MPRGGDFLIMDETFKDRFSDPALDAEQDRLRRQLDFSEANSYTPKFRRPYLYDRRALSR